MATLLNAQKILDKLRESVEYSDTTTEFFEEVEALDSELKKCYNDLRQLQIRPMSEILHKITQMVEDCCCSYWKARVKDAGDFCPDCAKHKGSVSLTTGEIRAVRGPRSRIIESPIKKRPRGHGLLRYR